MSGDEPKQGKSRRRFLADLLFLGGSVTAASLLAKSTLFEDGGQSPPSPKPMTTPNEPVPPVIRIFILLKIMSSYKHFLM